MPFRNRIDKDLGVAFVLAYGEISVEDLMDNELMVLQHSDYRKNFNMFLDLSRAQPHHTVDLGKVKMSKEFVESIQEKTGNCRWAVFAPDDSTYAFANMFEVISTDLTVKTRVFRIENDAKGWLGILGKGT